MRDFFTIYISLWKIGAQNVNILRVLIKIENLGKSYYVKTFTLDFIFPRDLSLGHFKHFYQ